MVIFDPMSFSYVIHMFFSQQTCFYYFNYVPFIRSEQVSPCGVPWENFRTTTTDTPTDLGLTKGPGQKDTRSI